MPADQRRTLEAWVRAQNTPQSIVLRARIALLAADGVPNSRIAREVGVSRTTVMLWRQRFPRGGPVALTKIAPGRGRRPTYGADRVNEIVQATTQTKPQGATHWSTRTMAKAQGINPTEIKRCGLEVIITTSEMLGEVNRRIIEEGFSVPVYDSYGLREAGFVGHDCEHKTMHCADEQVILETIDPNTLEPTAGEGELVITNIMSPTMPIIRYRTGDIVKLSNQPCPCGRSLSSISISGGRAVEFIVTDAGKWVIGYSFIYICRSVKGIIKFQVRQERIGQVRVLLVTDDNFPPDGAEQVAKAVRQRLGGNDEILVELVDDIRPSPSGKYRPVVSKVAEEMWAKGRYTTQDGQ